VAKHPPPPLTLSVQPVRFHEPFQRPWKFVCAESGDVGDPPPQAPRVDEMTTTYRTRTKGMDQTSYSTRGKPELLLNADQYRPQVPRA
jgi:hypothetical protein